MKAKVVFVVTGYGEKVNGGVEQHCKMLAERLVTDYDVEVLSTCVQNYVKGEKRKPWDRTLSRKINPIRPSGAFPVWEG